MARTCWGRGDPSLATYALEGFQGLASSFIRAVPTQQVERRLGEHHPHDLLSIPGEGNGAHHVVGVKAAAGRGRIPHPAWWVSPGAPGRDPGGQVAGTVEGYAAHGVVAFSLLPLPLLLPLLGADEGLRVAEFGSLRFSQGRAPNPTKNPVFPPNSRFATEMGCCTP